MSFSDSLVLIGGTGQLGSDIRLAAERAGIPTVALSHQDVEILSVESLQRTIQEIRPGVVINCAAFHQVDRCEEDPAQAFQTNAVGALNVARAAADTGARTIFISTDYVFDGRKRPPASGAIDPGTGYGEGDPTEPVNVYGVSKLAGERLTLLAGEQNLVVRVSSLFGVAGARGKGGNFIETILKRAREGGPLKVVNDQWMTPTYTWDAASAIVDLVRKQVVGTVHVANAGACTWHAFASAAVKAVGLPVAVEAVPASTWPSRVRRPVNSALATDKLAGLRGAALRPWEEALRAYLAAKGY